MDVPLGGADHPGERGARQQRIVRSPLGTLRLTAEGDALTELYFGEFPLSDSSASHPVLDLAEGELSAYFSGDLRTFRTPLAPRGTPFQHRVWAELQRIPYGETLSYGELADRLGDARAVRAVGLANGRNPISIFIPCHRVVGARGQLTGYGGGIERKAWLLAHEGARLAV